MGGDCGHGAGLRSSYGSGDLLLALQLLSHMFTLVGKRLTWVSTGPNYSVGVRYLNVILAKKYSNIVMQMI